MFSHQILGIKGSSIWLFIFLLSHHSIKLTSHKKQISLFNQSIYVKKKKKKEYNNNKVI